MNVIRTLIASLILMSTAFSVAQADSAKQAVIEKMKARRVSLEFTDAPLADVIEFLRSVTKINLMVDPEVLRERPDMRLTLSVKDLRVKNVVNLIGGFFKLTTDIRDGGIVILTEKDRIRGEFKTKVYDIRDLMFVVKDFRGPNIGLGNGGNSSPSVVFEYESESNNRPVNGPDALVELIQSNMGDAWEEELANLSVARGMLVATHTPQVHKKIVKLLSMLRASR